MPSKFLKILVVAVIIAGIIFIFLYIGNSRTFLVVAEKRMFNVKNLISFEEWQNQQTMLAALKKEEQAEMTFMAVGDVMLSRVVGQKMVKYNDYQYPFRKIKELISNVDVLFGNLESPIIAGPAVKSGSFSFRADPAVAQSLAWAGFDVLSLANNHILNQGENGLRSTFDLLEENGISFCGAGKNLAVIQDNFIIKEANGLRLGFICYSYGPKEYVATIQKAGIALMDLPKLSQDINVLRKEVDFLVVSMHAGVEYARNSSVQQQEFARAAIDAGADLVLGHHSHVIQEVEQYKGKYILYSLGNFVFDQMWSNDTRQGLAVKFVINKKGVKEVNYFPVIIDDYSQPRLANENEKAKILKYINK